MTVTESQTTATEATTTTGQIVQVDPRTLVLEVNVRADAALTPEFVGSIKTHGVLTPILVQRTADALHVRAGQRRTLASIEAGLTAIPAYVVDGDTDEARRIIEQMAENDHRAALADRDRVAAFQQLSLLGLSAAQIAKRTHTKKDHVTTALTVAGSEVAAAVTAKYDLTLDQAAVVAEFDENAEAVKALTVAAVDEPDQFAHVAQRLRDDRDEARVVADLTATLTEAGTPVIDRPSYDDKTIKQVRELATLDGDERTPLTEETHAECPGRAAWISTSSWDGVRAVHVCTDPKGNGHVDRYAYSGGTERQAGPMTEEQKAERRALIANNKAWKSAETVRREWLTGFAARKTAPKDAPTFLAARLVAGTHRLDKASTQTRHRLARTLLGLPEHVGYGAPDPLADLVQAATPARAQHIALIVLLAAIEDGTGTHTWRNVSAEDRAYFTALAAWGYSLSEVEALATVAPTYAVPVEDEAESEAYDAADDSEGHDPEGYDDGE
ncbi:ParB N-terminal domain-containing protein [Actinotalea ferrariae]|uniref:ParB/RepB/Spo0J family partition protein n=1 Tax=Actinotalea ferrariae TaxID=1386098 RepID=UPI001C8CDB50|nr:ParB N-terminal domain-containing protein [Actinotalea ferrariae]MBX9244641.1 ParB N-terminal domain-containing protein [Actinotalea ferrariae]